MIESTSSLIDAAEARFAEDGFEGASLRAVMRDAGTDPGAIHYHFGGREALAEAVLDRVLVPLNDRRLLLLDEIEAESSTPTVQELVAALIRPDLEAVTTLEGRGAGRGRLIGAIYLHPAAFVTHRVEARFGPVAQRFHPHLVAALPSVTPDLIGWRVRWVLFGTLGAVLSDRTELTQRTTEDLVALLVPTTAAAIAADPRFDEQKRTT